MSDDILPMIRKVFWCPDHDGYDDMHDFQDPVANIHTLQQVLEQQNTNKTHLPLYGFGGGIPYYGKEKYSDDQRVQVYQMLIKHGADPYHDVQFGKDDYYNPINDFGGYNYNYFFYLAIQMKEKLSVLEQAGMDLCHVDQHGNTLLDVVVSDVSKFYMVFQDMILDKMEWRNTFLDTLEYNKNNCLFYLTHQDKNQVVQCLVKAIRRDFQYGFNFFSILLQYGADPTQGNTWEAIEQELERIRKEALRSKLGNCINILKKRGQKQQQEQEKKDMTILMRIRWFRIMMEKTSKSVSRALCLSKLYHFPDRYNIHQESILHDIVNHMNPDMFHELLTFF